jgi:DNA-binding XRE family transcriptional regulator
MKRNKRKKLEALGYRVTTTQEFLRLSDEEMALIDLKISLIEKLKRVRKSKRVTQQELARMIGSSQPRIAALERGSPDVSLDLICRALFALGMTNSQIGKAISAKRAA